MEERKDNPKKLIDKSINRILTASELDDLTFDEIKNKLDDISAEYPLDKLKLFTWSSDEDYWEWMIHRETLETDEDYEQRLLQEERMKILRENNKKIQEVKEYEEFLKLKEKYEK